MAHVSVVEFCARACVMSAASAAVFENYDLLCLVLSHIDDCSAEVMGRAAAGWCVLNKQHAQLSASQTAWPVLVTRVSAKLLCADDTSWTARVCDDPTRDTFFELCSLARLRRTGVPREMVRTPFKIFLNTDGKRRWCRMVDAHAVPQRHLLTDERRWLWMVETWDRMDPLERGVYAQQTWQNFSALGFKGFRSLPGVRKLDS